MRASMSPICDAMTRGSGADASSIPATTVRLGMSGNQRASRLEARSRQRLQVRARHHTGAVHPEQSDDAETPIPDCESCCRCVRAGWL
jgi:hypothetical protein